MPELPEVETMRRGVLPVVGGRVKVVECVDCPRKPILIAPRIDVFRRRTVGRTIVDVRRAGKRVLVMLEGGDAIVFEPRMTGLVLIADPPDEKYLRLRMSLGARGELLYWDRRGLGCVRLLTPAEQESAFGLDRLGPDALVATADDMRSRLGRSRRAIKVALLDQRAIAGVGNLYASEMLHTAAIHPDARCHQLSKDDWQRLHAAMRAVLLDAIEHEGSTLSDGTYRNALNQQGSYQNCHRVYDREGQACPTCANATIERVVQAQRSTFYCPRCQAKRRTRR